jgi:hypothetical protein
MAISSNKIIAPVAITDPYNLLGIYPKNGVWDVADIVALERPLLQGGRPGRINKWSRHKPVRYPQAAPLSENYPQQSGGVTTYIDQWEGSETDKNQGIRYGLKATIPHGTNIVAIHDTSFDYVAYPHPGTDFCRLSDFDGYDHNAEPNLTGSRIGEISADVPYLFVDINYYDTSVNPTGVPVESWLALGSDKGIGDYYPAILVTDENGGSYARLLTNASTNTITTLRVKGTPMGDVWYSSFKVKFFNDGTVSPRPPVGQSDTFPGEDSIGANLKVTLFIIDRKSFEYWTGVSAQITLGDYFPIPTSIAMMAEVTGDYTMIEITNFSYFLNRFQMRIGFPNGTPTVGEKYAFRISGGGFTASYDYEYTGGTAAPIINVTPATYPMASGTYTVFCSVYAINQAGGMGPLLDTATTSVTYVK